MELRSGLTRLVHEGVGLALDPGALARGLLVAFTDRRGGVSRAPFDSLNLAARVGDDPGAVEENRRRAARAAGFERSALCLARQVHGSRAIEVGERDFGVVGDADILTTAYPGRVLAMLTADCAPVVVTGTDGIAVAHAGWRGLVAGVVERAVERVGEPRAAWVGPCIHACCYEVGPEIVAAFSRRQLPVAAGDRVDPGRAAAVALRRAGVRRVAASDDCTSCDPSFFSYRRDGVTGRQGAFAAIIDPGALPGS